MEKSKRLNLSSDMLEMRYTHRANRNPFIEQIIALITFFVFQAIQYRLI